GDVSRFEQKNGNESRVWQYNYTYSSNRVPATLIVTQPNGDQEEFIFDIKGQITQRIVDGLVTSYSHYDALGNVGRITYPDGTQMRFQYDSRSRIIVEEVRATTGQARIKNYQYNRFGHVAKTEVVNGPEVEYSYDLAGRLITQRLLNGQEYDERVLQRDLMGNVIQELFKQRRLDGSCSGSSCTTVDATVYSRTLSYTARGMLKEVK